MRLIVERFIRAYGPVSIYAIGSYTQFPITEVNAILGSLDLETITVGESREQMYLFKDELDGLVSAVRTDEAVKVVSLYDPCVQSIWAQIAAKYGDRWIFPIVSNGKLIGAAEKWNMSGCIEVRDLELDDPETLPEALIAIDDLMRFYQMMGYDIVRLREVLGKLPADMPAEVSKELISNGYHRIGDMYAKGNFVIDNHPWEEVLSYILWKQKVPRAMHFVTIPEAMKVFGGLRSDPSAALRCNLKVPLKKLLEQGLVVKVPAIPDYVTYATLDFASLCRKAKGRVMTEDMSTLMKMVDRSCAHLEGRPVQSFDGRSPCDERSVKGLVRGDAHLLGWKTKTDPVPEIDMSVDEGRREIIRHIFRNFGVFSAENLSRFIRYEMPMKELRTILADLEKEGLLVKGFLIKDDDTVHWALRDDLDRIGEIKVNESFVLSPEDNLHFYLQPWIKQEVGGTFSTCDGGSKDNLVPSVGRVRS